MTHSVLFQKYPLAESRISIKYQIIKFEWFVLLKQQQQQQQQQQVRMIVVVAVPLIASLKSLQVPTD